MTDDIATRLRAAWKDADEVAAVHLAKDAADEIERLRAELETYKDLYASEIVKKAVRGE
jgi:predicted translin family RNA/ssDNA-binding protein